MTAAPMPQARVLGFDVEFLREMGFQWLNVIIMVGILAYLLYKPVKNYMRRRAERVSSQIGAAESANRDAAALKADYEAKLVGIEKERGDVLEAARAKAVERGEEIVKDARGEAEAIRSRARGEIDLEAKRVRDEMRTQLVELSAAMAGRLIRSSLSGDEQARLADEALAELRGAKWAE